MVRGMRGVAIVLLLLPLCGGGGRALAGGKGKSDGEPDSRAPFNRDKVSRGLRERRAGARICWSRPGTGSTSS